MLSCSLVGCPDVTAIPVERAALTPTLARPIRTIGLEGDVELGGSIALADVPTHRRPVDPADGENEVGLHLPNLEASLYGRAYVVDGLTVGAHFGLTHHALTTPTVASLHRPGSEVAIRAGPEGVYVVSIETSPLSIAFGGSVDIATIPWVERYDGFPDRDGGTTVAVLFHLATAAQLEVVDGLVLETGIAFRGHVQNDAFGVEVPDGRGDLSWDAWFLVPYATLRLVHPTGVTASAQLQVLVGLADIDAEPVAGTFSLGYVFGVW